MIKKLSSESIVHANEIFLTDENNPAFNFLKKNYPINTKNFSECSDLLNGVAGAGALKYAEMNSTKANDHLVHYFFDLLLALNSGLFSHNKEIASLAIDGIHLKYFGNISDKVIISILQLIAEKDKCLFNSFLSILKEPGYPMKLASFAYYCLYEEVVGATEAIVMAKQIMLMVEHISERLEKEVVTILKR